MIDEILYKNIILFTLIKIYVSKIYLFSNSPVKKLHMSTVLSLNLRESPKINVLNRIHEVSVTSRTTKFFLSDLHHVE